MELEALVSSRFALGSAVSTVSPAICSTASSPAAMPFRAIECDVLVRRRVNVGSRWRPKPPARHVEEYFRQS